MSASKLKMLTSDSVMAAWAQTLWLKKKNLSALPFSSIFYCRIYYYYIIYYIIEYIIFCILRHVYVNVCASLCTNIHFLLGFLSWTPVWAMPGSSCRMRCWGGWTERIASRPSKRSWSFRRASTRRSVNESPLKRNFHFLHMFPTPFITPAATCYLKKQTCICSWWFW